MDARQFLAEFGHIANAPGGVVKLRELILQLAISGRLTERVEGDTYASVLIEANMRRQKTLIAEKTLKRQPAPGPVTSSDQPWVLPEGWSWTRLGFVTNYGDAPKVELNDVTDGTWVLELEDIEKGTSKLLVRVCARERKFRSTKNGFPAGAVLYGKLRPYLDKVLIAESPGVCTTEISPISFFENIDAGYLRWYLKSPYFIAYADGSTYGMNLPRLGTDSAREALFAFPPQKEQARIVAKVDELMALCDKLETQQQDRRKLQNKLRQSTLQAVASATSPHELQTSWVRLADNFGQLFHEPEDVRPLMSLVLNLAMRGLLVDQFDLDTPAELLLEEIDLERQQLIAVKRLKASTVIPLPQEDELPYLLPRGWIWARVIDLVDVGTGATPSKSEPSYYGGDTPWYTSSATNEKFAPKPEATITEKALTETNCKVFPAGSLIVALYGQGKTRGQVSEITVAGATNQALAALVFFKSSLKSKRFIKYYFEKIYDEIRLQAEGGPQPNLNVGKIKETLIPVPPIEEQERIVARLDELMLFFDQMGKQLRESRKLAERLAASAVASLTDIAIEQEEEPMKAPQTELLAPLRLGTALLHK